MATTTLDEVDKEIRAIITNLYMVLCQAHEYQGQNTNQAMQTEMRDLLKNLKSLTQKAMLLPTHLPVDIIQYVENSRNPDIYTREFVEAVMRYNQQQKGRSEAYGEFHDILAQTMISGIPDLAADVKKVALASGRPVD
ncbi:Putative mediator complex, subunit Med10 [Septoria linicola]|uniref:Mediator of RNA polymerase II transcription subunit 10 n=1 Tax=Septoria linicola TaxID=215465 RepID=A0A9Q9ADP1_9PEZI|nr:putative mediator complex, subunit Med10 [Septoria linicola]USW47210.1 Putative mediator complex, subunit Med10 [Septoria linicola]